MNKADYLEEEFVKWSESILSVQPMDRTSDILVIEATRRTGRLEAGVKKGQQEIRKPSTFIEWPRNSHTFFFVFLL